MPTNKKESLIFTCMMCSMMVLGMSLYNLLLHHHFSFPELIKGFIPGFMVAFILDEFVVGVLAKKIAAKAPIDPEKPIQIILTITFAMVLGMVTCMSLFGIIMELGFPESMLGLYLHAWKMNFIVALPLQLFIVGPISRKVLTNIQN